MDILQGTAGQVVKGPIEVMLTSSRGRNSQRQGAKRMTETRLELAPLTLLERLGAGTRPPEGVAALQRIQHPVSPPHPAVERDGVERFVQSALTPIRKFATHDPATWDLELARVQLAMNGKGFASRHRSTPFAMMLRRRLTDPGDPTVPPRPMPALVDRYNLAQPALADKSRRAAAAEAARFNASQNLVEFPVGTAVKIHAGRPRKLEAAYTGPFTVTARNAGGAYVLVDAAGNLAPCNC
jgi:hypothetical protein